jgi:tetratricopeptide (TPR) repeat protein
MSKATRSLQDRIRDRQQSGFVGRQGQVIQYQENFSFPLEDERRRFLFNIHGDAGVGKTFLTGQFRQIATGIGALTAYVDQTAEDLTSTMTAMAAQFSRVGCKLGDFEKRVDEYRQRRHEVESDPHAPAGFAAFLTKTAVTIGLAAARDIPVAGSLLAPVDVAATADQANEAREYLARRLSDHRDVRLLLSPADELTPVFVSGLSRAIAGHTAAFFFDTYERTGLLLDAWLRNLYAGRYGDLPETLITTISGQNPLDPNLWSEYLPVIADIPLEPFSEAEARQFLASKVITDEPTIKEIIRLSGRLPLWLATLADARMQGNADIGDPSGNAVERFLKWEADPARREVAMAAALPRILNQDVLAVVSPTAETRALFDWLRRLPFVAQQGESWVYHDVVRAAMLRLRRAEAPAEWRAEQKKLAQANATWASESAAGTADAWANADWVDYRREEIYHSLCADAHRTLPQALASAVKAAGQSTIRARQWAALIADAGRDTGNDRLREWGRRLEECIHGDDRIPYLTCLINDATLDKANLVVAYKERGGQYHDVGRYADALADYSRAIELNPESAQTIASHGDMLRHLLRYEEALADYTRAIEIKPESARFRAGRGDSYSNMGRYVDALADYNRAIDINPKSAITIAGRGRVLRQLRRYGEALADFSRAIEISPESGWIIAGRGDVYHDIGRYNDAFSDFTSAIELNPKDVHAFTDRGDIHNHLGHYREGIADLNQAIKLDPKNIRAMSTRGESYRLLKRYDDALTDFNRAIELDPTHAQAICNRGRIRRAMGQYDDAIADLTRATELTPDRAWIIAIRGATYQVIGRYDDALADLNRAIELDPTDVWAVGKRCQAHLAMGQFDDAQSDMTRVLELAGSPEAKSENRAAPSDYVPMAIDMLNSGHRKEAAAIFEAASKLFPDDPDALNNWAFCLMPDSPDLALQLLDRAAQIHQKDALIPIANRLRCLLQLDRQSAVLAVTDRVISTLSSYPCEFAYLWSLDGFTLEEVDDVRQYIIDCISRVIDNVSDRDVFVQWNAVLTEVRAAVSSE